MGLLQGLRGRFLESAVTQFPLDVDLAQKFPSIPAEYLSVLVAFMEL